MMKNINVLGLPGLTLLATVPAYQSAVAERVWNGISSLDITINSGVNNARAIQRDRVIFLDQEYAKAYVVEYVQEVGDKGSETLKIKATALEGLLADYITIPPAGTAYDARTGTREAVARAWVNANVIAPADMTRATYPIILGGYGALGEVITDQSRYAVLTDELERVLAPEDLGYRLRVDLSAHVLVFEVTAGIDRTEGAAPDNRTVIRRDDDAVDFSAGVSYNVFAGPQGLRLTEV